jgi:hypothetical protein
MRAWPALFFISHAGAAVKKTLLLLAAVLICLATGCGGDKDKGINSGKDRPRAADRAE